MRVILLIEACHMSPSACDGGDVEYIRVNEDAHKIERNVL